MLYFAVIPVIADVSTLLGCICVRKLILLVVFALTFTSYNAKKSNAIKIIAVVGESVITDLDAEDFSQILCIMQNMKKCDTKSIFPMSVIISIATTTTIIEMVIAVCDTPFLYLSKKIS